MAVQCFFRCSGANRDLLHRRGGKAFFQEYLLCYFGELLPTLFAPADNLAMAAMNSGMGGWILTHAGALINRDEPFGSHNNPHLT